MATDLELGAISWINKNYMKAKAHGLHGRDCITDPATIDQLRNKAQLTEEDLQKLGSDARQHGCFHHYAEGEYNVAGEKIITVFRPVGPGWSRVDGTMPQSLEDESRRYSVGTNWKNNSCAIDAALFCGIMLNAGRISADQISLTRLLALPIPAQILRRLVSQPWGRLHQVDRDRLRDALVNTLIEMQPPVITKGEFASVNKVFEVCFQQLPQLSCSFLRVTMDCDKKWKATGKALDRTLQEVGLQIMEANEKLSIEEIVNGMLQRRILPQTPSCSSTQSCKGEHFRVRLILDRMPPTLLLFLPDLVSEIDNRNRCLFHRLNLTYERVSGQDQIQYEPIGCVFARDMSHFFVRWKTGAGEGGHIIHFDGLVSSNVSEVDGWWADIKGGDSGVLDETTKTGVILMFYRQV